MKRIRLFLKGNVDLHDSLHSCRINNTICWNGINQIQNLIDANIRIQIKHETWTRSDALLECSGTVPLSLKEKPLRLDAFSAASQFSEQLFTSEADAYVLSIQPDITVSLVRHRKERYLFHPAHFSHWSEEEIIWFKGNFEAVEPLTPQESMNNLRLIIERLRKKTSAPIMIYNASFVIPGDHAHCHAGLTDSLSTRIQKFNLGLIDLSNETGISIIDVNRILACHGVDRTKLSTWHLNEVGLRLIAQETSSVLQEYFQ